MHNLLSIIKLAYLRPLGLNEEYFLVILIVLGMIFIYSFIQPVINWFVSLKLIRLLSYMVSSLLLFNIAILVIVLKPNLLDYHLLTVHTLFQVIAFFGVCLILYHTIRKVIEIIKMNIKKTTS